jgi:hypothetical protein
MLRKPECPSADPSRSRAPAVYALGIGRLRIGSFATAIATTVPRERLGAPALASA